jgi:hypothetical protein
MRRYHVTLELTLPDQPTEEDYIRAILDAVPLRASLVSDGNEQSEQKGESDGNRGDNQPR